MINCCNVERSIEKLLIVIIIKKNIENGKTIMVSGYRNNIL